MSRLKFEKFRQLVSRLYDPLLESWPAKLSPECLTLLQYHEAVGGSPDGAMNMQGAIEASIACEELPFTQERYLRQPLAWEAGIGLEAQLVPVVLPAITGEDFANWLAVQGERPSEIIADWFAALDLNSEPGTTMPAAAAVPAAEVAARLTTPAHSQSGATKRDLLTPVIERAQRECTDRTDAAAVWNVLSNFAKTKVNPFLGKHEDGLQWVDHNDEPKTLTLKMLRDRVTRQKMKQLKPPKA
jgi:hypothetical protein